MSWFLLVGRATRQLTGLFLKMGWVASLPTMRFVHRGIYDLSLQQGPCCKRHLTVATIALLQLQQDPVAKASLAHP